MRYARGTAGLIGAALVIWLAIGLTVHLALQQQREGFFSREIAIDTITTSADPAHTLIVPIDITREALEQRVDAMVVQLEATETSWIPQPLGGRTKDPFSRLRRGGEDRESIWKHIEFEREQRARKVRFPAWLAAVAMVSSVIFGLLGLAAVWALAGFTGDQSFRWPRAVHTLSWLAVVAVAIGWGIFVVSPEFDNRPLKLDVLFGHSSEQIAIRIDEDHVAKFSARSTEAELRTMLHVLADTWNEAERSTRFAHLKTGAVERDVWRKFERLRAWQDSKEGGYLLAALAAWAIPTLLLILTTLALRTFAPPQAVAAPNSTVDSWRLWRGAFRLWVFAWAVWWSIAVLNLFEREMDNPHGLVLVFTGTNVVSVEDHLRFRMSARPGITREAFDRQLIEQADWMIADQRARGNMPEAEFLEAQKTLESRDGWWAYFQGEVARVRAFAVKRLFALLEWLFKWPLIILAIGAALYFVSSSLTRLGKQPGASGSP